MNSTIRIDLPGDSDGRSPSGLWWATGWCRPRYMWDRSDRPAKRRFRLLRTLLARVR